MLSAIEYEQCRDAFFKSMNGFTDSGTIMHAKIETAWQLKRIADCLEVMMAHEL